MKRILVCTALLCNVVLSAQINGSSGHTIFAVEVGLTEFHPRDVNNFLFPNEKGFVSFITYGGGWTATTGTHRAHNYDATIAFHFFQPQKLKATYDSLSYEVRGWELMTSLFAYDVLHNVDVVDLTLAPGVYWGGLRIRKYFNGGNPNQFELFKNPFIAPMLRADLRFVLGPVAVGGRASWRYDISKGHWKKGSSVTLPEYKFRELQYVVYLGWRFAE
jgi:hypothetical protein